MSTGHVIIAGAGIAGLTAASALARAGVRVTVLEAAGFLGGRFSTKRRHQFAYGGRSYDFPIDHGIHGAWRQYRNLRRLLDDHGLSEQLVPSGQQELIVPAPDGGTLHMEVGSRLRETMLPDVLMPAALLTQRDMLKVLAAAGPRMNLGIARRMFHGLAFDPATETDRYDDRSVQDLIEGWPPLVQHLFSALTHASFFRPPAEVSLAAFFTSLWCYVYADKRDTDFQFFGQDAHSGLVAPIVRDIEARGGRVLGRHPVQSIELDDGALVRVTARDLEKQDHRRFEGDALILALDPPGLARLAEDPTTGSVLPTARAEWPRGLPCTSVRLWSTGRRQPGRSACGVFSGLAADAFFWLDELQSTFSGWREQTGGSVLELHLYGERASRSLTASDEAVLKRTSLDVERAWPELAGTIVHGHVERNEATHVALGPGVMRSLPSVATRSPRVALAGDWIACSTPVLYLERACVTALEAARQVAPMLGVERARLPAVLPPHPPAANVAQARRVLRALRDRGWLGAI